MPSKKEVLRLARKKRIRSRVIGSAERPRLVVSRSLKHIRAQIIDDATHAVLAAASDVKVSKGTKSERASQVGADVAKMAQAKGVSAVVFDRTGRKYHGRVKAVADAAREAGLKF